MRRVHPMARIHHARARQFGVMAAFLAAVGMADPAMKAEVERRRRKRGQRHVPSTEAKPKDSFRGWCGIKKVRMVRVGPHSQRARATRRFPITRPTSFADVVRDAVRQTERELGPNPVMADRALGLEDR